MNDPANAFTALATAALLALAFALGPALAASDTGRERFPPNSPPYPQAQKGEKKGAQKKKKEQKSEQDFRDGYRLAFTLVQAGAYEAAFAAFKELDADDHPDVANYLGYTARKLGDYELSRVWYERALESDPKHVRTWQYYGMWHVEQGNLLMAQDFLEKVRLICGGTECEEYVKLKGVIEGTVTY